MNVLQGYNPASFMTFVSKIRNNIGEWRIIDVSLTGKTAHNICYIAIKLKEYFNSRDGIIFICNNREILIVIHTGRDISGQSLAEGIYEKMPKYSCDAHGEDMTVDGLLRIQMRLHEFEKNEKEKASASLLDERKSRQETVIMVVDDDMFMRTLVAKTFQYKGRVLEFSDAQDIVRTYLEELPDIMFLDIHLPGGSGIHTLSEILEFDSSAYIIIISADSVKNNVLEARKYGAQDFIAKPSSREKLLACYTKCPTINFTWDSYNSSIINSNART